MFVKHAYATLITLFIVLHVILHHNGSFLWLVHCTSPWRSCYVFKLMFCMLFSVAAVVVLWSSWVPAVHASLSYWAEFLQCMLHWDVELSALSVRLVDISYHKCQLSKWYMYQEYTVQKGAQMHLNIYMHTHTHTHTIWASWLDLIGDCQRSVGMEQWGRGAGTANKATCTECDNYCVI